MSAISRPPRARGWHVSRRGFFGWDEYIEITKEMMKLFGEGIKIDSIFACGSISTIDCSWRKPGTGMIYRGWTKSLLESKNSILVGDKSSDIQTGISSNIKNLFHVLTGHGEEEKEKVKALINMSEYNYKSERLVGNLFFQTKNLYELLDILKRII